MVLVLSRPDVYQRLKLLSTDAQYDLACACSTSKEEHRRRGEDGQWIYPISLPNGGKSVLFKTLLSNVCSNDCKYCPLRAQLDSPRCSLEPQEVADVFLDYLRRRKVFGLFLSSACFRSPDATMEKLNFVAQILRKKHRFGGYIHLKVIPGASSSAIEQALSLANAVSLNIETPGEEYLRTLSNKKKYLKDIIEPMKLISRLTAPGAKYAKTKQTTQFIVGAAGENDEKIVKYTEALYKRLNMQRVYFSAYQQGLGEVSLPGEQDISKTPAARLLREHRLYQVDFLLRRYGFDASEIPFDEAGNLSLSTDPKESWAKNHPEFFPVNVNSASKRELLRVPGLGPIAVRRILDIRKQGKIGSIEAVGKPDGRLQKAQKYMIFD